MGPTPSRQARPVALVVAPLFPVIGGMETHGMALREHLRARPASPPTLICDAEPGALGPDLLRRLSALERPVVFLNSCHWIEHLDAIREAAPTGTIVQRTGGNEVFKARHSDAGLRLDQRQRVWVEAINRQVDVLISNSTFTTRRLVDLGIQPARIRQVRGGFDARRCASAARGRAGHRARVFGTGDALCVATCSRLVAFKGLGDVVAAVGAAQASHDVRLAVVGDGPLRAELETAAAATLRGGSYRFLGSLPPDECLDVMAASDVYAGLPLELVQRKRQGYYVRTETMGRSFYEAIACGTRIVGTDVGGLPELAAEWNGALVPASDTGAAAAAMISQGVAGRIDPERVRRFRAAFSWRRVFRTYRDWFDL